MNTKTLQIILLGPPGVGKGTQAESVASYYGIAHISTGDMFRENVSKGTELGKKAHAFMAAGDLVPDEIVIGMVEDRLSQEDCKGGFLLDGFPRTIAQAEALGVLLEKIGRPVTVVMDLAADENVLVERLSGRRVCKACGATYHVQNKPTAIESICDVCGGEVIQREDDRPEAIRRRLVEYREKTAALTEYYKGKGLLEEVEASGKASDVFETMKERLAARTNGAIKVAG